MNPDSSARLSDTGPDLDEFGPQGVDLGTLEFCAFQMFSHQEKQTVKTSKTELFVADCIHRASSLRYSFG